MDKQQMESEAQATHVSNMSDHDLLIRLDTKFDGLKQDVKNTSDGIITRIADHETRLNAIEQLRDEIKPKELSEITRKNSQWIHDFKLTYKIMIGLITVSSIAVGFILTTVLQVSKIIGGGE